MTAWFRHRQEKHERRLSPELVARVAAWQALPEVPKNTSLADVRFAVVDVETTGLDTDKDKLIAIAAIMITRGVIEIVDSFEVVLRQMTASRSDNILIHRIAGHEQLAGTDPAEGLIAFLEFVGKAPLVAYHAPFDAIMLTRALKQYLHLHFSGLWFDLARLTPALLQKGNEPAAHDLDDWLARIGIRIKRRHRAVADAMGTAQLMQVLLSHCPDEQIGDLMGLTKLIRNERWLRPQ